MSSTTDTTDTRDVTDLDVRTALLEAAGARRTADREEARLLALAIQIVHLHPVDEDTPTASFADPSFTVPDHPITDHLSDHLAGHGTPQVAERAVEELAAALDLSYGSGCRLVADALELSYRLPKLWALVQSGKLQAWKARKVAQLTTTLGEKAVAFVDAQAAIHGARNRHVPNIAGLVHAALVRFEPEQAKKNEQDTKDRRGVRFDYQPIESDGVAGSATVYAHLDQIDAHDLDTAVSEVANQLGRLGDESPLDERRARALGRLAHPQGVIDLFEPPRDPDADTTEPTKRTRATGLAATSSTTTATIYLHIDVDDLRTIEDGTPAPGTAEKLGSATLDLISDWLQRASGVTIRPVLDMSRTDAVDRHDPPEWMRDLVVLRDGHCVFPGCGIDARRCDLDHTIPYLPIDEGGPPRQTNPANLACLCRRHHRLKTLTAWSYQRAGPGHYRWTNPHGLTYESRSTPKS